MSAELQHDDANSGAADWDVRLRSHTCTDHERQAFEQWRNADPRHREAFDRLQQLLKTVREASAHRPELQSLREASNQYLDRVATQRAWGKGLAMAAGIAALSLVTVFSFPSGRQWLSSWYRGSPPAIPGFTTGVQTYATVLNERSTVTLTDGSTVSLNSRTRLNVQLAGATRRVTLLAGQALFRVSKDPSRPFIVTAGTRTVTALGTEFDVRVDPDKLQVTLLEGKVAVQSTDPAALGSMAPVMLKPREQFVAMNGFAPTVREVDVDKTTAWTEGRIFFADETLGNAIAELNRYSDTALVVVDPVIANYQINGMFRVGNQAGFADAVSSMYDVETRTDGTNRILLSRRIAGNHAR